MPQGFKNSPGIFQLIMDRILASQLDKKCCVYLDDIIVFGKTEQEHDNNLNEVLKLLEAANLKVNINKIQYKASEVRLLGCVIDGVKQKPISEKQKKILEFTLPGSKTELQRFLGFVNYYRKFIPNCAHIASPLYDALKGKDQIIIWDEEKEKSFENLKKIVSSKISTYIPDFNEPFVVTTDASNTGIGAILKQIINGEERVVDWASKKLSDAEKKYGITEKEFLAMAWAIEHYEYYLKGRKFKVITDHQALIAMKNKEIFGSLKLERMRERLQQYDFTIEYKKGETLIDADAVSRLNETINDLTEYEKKSKNLISGNDGKYYWKIDGNTIKECPKIIDRLNIAKQAHDDVEHRGRDATASEIKNKYYWPNMIDTVTTMIKHCEPCNKNYQKNNGGEVYIASSNPFEKIGIDLLMIAQDRPVLTFIDYYTRIAKIRLLKSKSEIEITKALEEIFNETGYPKLLISDNGKEFVNKKIEKILNAHSVSHHKCSPEKHQSNGRVERLHRTIWQGIRKYQLGEIKDYNELNCELQMLIEKYNNTEHRAIGLTPNEALIEFMNQSENLIIKSHKYEKEFKTLNRENFEEGEEVYLKRSLINLQTKKDSLFDKKVKIIKKLDNDSYLVQDKEKIFKRNHYSLKKMLLITYFKL